MSPASQPRRYGAPLSNASFVSGAGRFRNPRLQPFAAWLPCQSANRGMRDRRCPPVTGRHCIVLGSHITTQGKAISSPSRTTSVATNGITPR